ncbi:MAG: MYXO-CTERM sorting domain-containing protein [bacterium]
MRCALVRNGYHRVATLATLALLGSIATAHAIPLVAIDGGAGLPGGTAAAIIALSDDVSDLAVSADIAMHFADPPLATNPAACTLAARLAATHRLTASSPLSGELLLAIAPLTEPASLGDGPLVTCDFGIALGTPAGTTALSLEDVEVRDAGGTAVPIDLADGFITILPSGPTPTVTITPTVSATPTLTATLTFTVVPPPSDTPTPTPTPTLFRPTVLFDTGGTCAVAPPQRGGRAWMLVAALIALVVWRQRR